MRRLRYILLFLLVGVFICCLFAAARMASWRRPAVLHTRPSSSSSPRSITVFSVGDFLQGASPQNMSFCTFPFGTVDNFTVPKEQVMGSPELGFKGPYRVLYNSVLGSAFNETRLSVTFVTHATVEYIVHIAQVARVWDGPVSVACFVPGGDTGAALRTLEMLCSCEPAMRKVSVHFIFHARFIPNASEVVWNESETCAVPASFLVSIRAALKLPYPVNVARNVARLGARTDWLLVADIELFPSAGLAVGFLDMIERLARRRTGDHSFLKKRHVFVVPVFEVVAGIRRLPRTKKELLKLHAHEQAVYFHRFVCIHCQRFPGLQQWLQRRNNPRNEPNLVQPMLVVKRELPHDRWEPVYIGTQREPLYSETLTWEGQQDKMTQMYEMCLLDYRFVILDGAFLVHTPGIKHRKKQTRKDGNETEPAEREEQLRRNSYLYRVITNDLTSRYGNNNRCRRQ